MISYFKLTGLSKPLSFTMETSKGIIFHAPALESCFTYQGFDELFKYCKGNWADNKQARVAHNGFAEDGTPIEPKVMEINEKE